ncbi:bifunctional [glutamate--ammonia ligase]-adenylyl-L-tyrosine phosphorylase/[glutamate--ammonia-ligase] adenylyltransferase [Teredinibacter purpureus]|uniref:bifunctional [glutamate--ammonia ligase]-adenylyl-L-tyrosine phosphorylase/[glutamate--ammonia-ligase] adenylyltransferase n=1 Tax=Teredinibacter purpureus TaxID=2731756 RepID=UPI0005F81AC0|nr:bifunctional [glutamate--ammonia ligase]-adenylyl-L-tyrosine phosphorylase/[glutamate--ammonia-ligase] adenylyltransferase [Teredinibacter purpureus]
MPNHILAQLQQQGFSTDKCDRYQRFLQVLAEQGAQPFLDTLLAAPQGDATLSDQFLLATAHSDFVQTQCERNPHWLDMDESRALTTPKTQLDYTTECAARLHNCADVNTLNQTLRQFRNESMVGIIWRDFNRLVETLHTTQELTWLAETCIQHAMDAHYQSLLKKHGEPHNTLGEAQPMLVIGMGKLGAGELNLSSDIDLIFAYPDTGETAGKRSISNQEFFIKLGKLLIQSLDAITADGFVFRVDMRLRPYGQSGPLVAHFNALEDYYQTQGREWERYAMIKARVVATTLAGSNSATSAINTLNQLINSFTYRRYVDFSVVDALRDLKKKINQEVIRRKLGDDVKLGGGGIREIEFIAQAFQLIRGGRDTQLQDNRLMVVLPLLEELNCLPAGKASALANAYQFLRNTEHAIQGYQDKQTQKLPSDPDQRLSIAVVLGFPSWDTFYHQLQQHQQLVKDEFAEVIASPDDKPEAELNADCDWNCIWQDSQDPDAYLALLAQYGHEEPIKSLEVLEELRMSHNVVMMQPEGRQRLDAFIPRLLNALAHTATPSETLRRVLLLVRSVARRSAYLLLLIENPGALRQLVTLSAASPWIAQELAARPALLDELLDQRTLYHLPNKAELIDELRRATLRIAEDDLEEQMEALRYFRSAHALRVAACEITGSLPLMKVSDYLTWLAETLLDYILASVWQQMTTKHGYPDGEERPDANFVIVGYGKLGGFELAHGSDLDLVFIHNATPMGSTDGDARGKKSVDNQTFYMRLGQKIIHMLNTRMASGELYEVDMRLRPSGNSGMLVTTIAAFEKYQLNEAWTWEHQALVRARVVAGDTTLTPHFDGVRQRILEITRDTATLQKDVATMREKMRAHLGSDKHNDGTAAFHLKQDRGGIVDIEFMVQYAVLAWANKVPALTRFTDNIRILESLAQSNLLSAQEVDKLTSAYKALRSLGHRLTLQQQPSLVKADQLSEDVTIAREQVTRLWKTIVENDI